MCKIIIAIPTYNRESYLRDCLISILNQSFQDFLILIFDNCSNYDIVGMVKEFNDKRIEVVKNEVNLGNDGNFKKIFNYNFESDYLVIFHDDDTMHPDFLKKGVSLMDENGDMVWVGTSMNFVKNKNKMLDFSKIKNKKPLILNKHDLIRCILRWFRLNFGSIMYRVKYVEDIEPFFKNFFKWCDRPFLISLIRDRNVGIIEDELVNYRIHSNQDSQAAAIDKSECLFNLFIFYKENLPQPLSKNDKKLFYSFTTNNIISDAGSCGGSVNFRSFLNEARRRKLLNFRFLSWRALYYFVNKIRLRLIK